MNGKLLKVILCDNADEKTKMIGEMINDDAEKKREKISNQLLWGWSYTQDGEKKTITAPDFYETLKSVINAKTLIDDAKADFNKEATFKIFRAISRD